MVFVFLWLFLVSTGCGLSKHITLNLLRLLDGGFRRLLQKKRKIECNGARVGRTSSFSLRVLKAVAVSLVPGRGLCLKQLDEWNRDMEQREKGGPSTWGARAPLPSARWPSGVFVPRVYLARKEAFLSPLHVNNFFLLFIISIMLMEAILKKNPMALVDQTTLWTRIQNPPQPFLSAGRWPRSLVSVSSVSSLWNWNLIKCKWQKQQ